MENICNSKQKWNHGGCWCVRKELNDRGSCKNDYMWNPSTCNFECNKASEIDEYSNSKNGSCKKRHLMIKK